MPAQQSRILLPETFVSELKLTTAREVREQYADTLILLIELSGPQSPLARPLEELIGREAKRRRPHVDVMTTLEVPAHGSGGLVTEPDRMELLAKLESASWFILPLLKRSTSGDLSQITVGRGDDNDVVLKDRSVSSHHGYFETQTDGSLSLTDANSTNGTRVNGTSVTGGEVQWVQPMDHIRFGSVSTFTCMPSVLRSVLRAIVP